MDMKTMQGFGGHEVWRNFHFAKKKGDGMMKVTKLCIVLMLVAGLQSVVAADVMWNFDSYTTGNLFGQDDWSAADTTDIAVKDDTPYGGSGKYLSMTGSDRAAVHSTDQVYDSGMVVFEFANRRNGPGSKSGKFFVREQDQTTLIGVGVDTSGGDNWLVAHGEGGTNRIYHNTVATPWHSDWFLMRLELDLDNSLADVYWRDSESDPWTTIFTDYALASDAAVENIRLENRSYPVGYDEISITPEPATLTLLGLGGMGCLIRRKK